MEAAELVAGCGRLGRSVGRGRTGVVTVSTGEASLVADLAERTGLDLPPVPDAARGDPARPADDGLHRQPARPVGRRRGAAAYGASFEALAASGAYDVLAIVHDSPFRDLPSEVEVANDVSRALIDATAARPEILPVYVSLTAGDMSEETKATLDAAGGMPMLRGALEAFGAIGRLTRWERRRLARAGRRHAAPSGRPSRPAALRGARTTRSTRSRARLLPGPRRPVRAREPRAARRGRRRRDAVRAVAADDDGDEAVAAWRELGGGPVALKLDAPGLAHKTEAGGVRLGLATNARSGPRSGSSWTPRERRGHLRGLLVEPMAAPGIELIVGGTRDAVFGPAVLVGLGGILAEVLDDVAVLLAPVTADEVRERLSTLRGASLLRGVRGRPGVDIDAMPGSSRRSATCSWPTRRSSRSTATRSSQARMAPSRSTPLVVVSAGAPA